MLRWTAEGSHLWNDLVIIMQSFATERVNRGGDRMTPLGIRMSGSLYLAKSAGELTLQSADPQVQPFLDYRYLRDELDRKRMELASDEALDEFLLREVTTGQHIVGTCKMGPASDPLAVVDQYGKVHGLHGLRVADASIMPDCIRANTNVTTMMIGERIADFIRQGK
jgi:choline dehydrogenase